MDRFVDTLREQISQGKTLDIVQVELGLRTAALRDAAALFFSLMSQMEEKRPFCHKCGDVMSNQGKRKKAVVSLLGEGTLERNYWECPSCAAHAIPKDELLHITNTSFTPGVRKVAARLGSLESFGEASTDALELCAVVISAKEVERIAEAIGEEIEVICEQRTKAAFSQSVGEDDFATGETIDRIYIECDGTGIPTTKRECEGRTGKQEDGTAKTREVKLGCAFTQSSIDDEGNPVRDKNSTTYFGAIEGAEDFGRRMYAQALHRGLARAQQTVIIGDGAKWIWNQAELHFPDAIQIVDLFHAKEHICSLVKTLTSDDESRTALRKECYALLERGDIKALTKRFCSLPVSDTEQQKALEKECGYFTENAKRMQYAKFKKMGMFVGSGVIEAGCKNVIGKRLKQSGMHWSVRGANAIIALRCSIKSETFDSDFESLLAA